MASTECLAPLCVDNVEVSSADTTYPALTFALQSLLARHEAYMASAERDRVDMQSRIEQLEMEKESLAAENARTTEENHTLADQLELLNTTVADSETRILTLEATLQSSQQAVRRLEGAAARAAEMERHIALLEAEQAFLQNTLINTESEARSAMSRWRKAERGLADLQEQLERIEKEAREERERHVEILGRLERQREMEKDLNTAAGRLKGAAAAKSLNNGKNGSSVVSHFVRDLLQDNANLQLGIAELRELLLNSNDEIQHLREQLAYHQPVPEGEASAASTLRAELEPSDQSPQRTPLPTSKSQELHIHHHYHVTNKADLKKPKKKRQSLNPGIFAPPNMSYPSTPPNGQWPSNQGSPVPAMISNSARNSVSTIPSNRWSVFSEQLSEFAPSSVPSSPTSNPRNSMFDPGIQILSIPTSPTTSVDPMSPTWRSHHKKQASEVSRISFLAPAPLQLDAPDTSPPRESTPRPSPQTDVEEESFEDDNFDEPEITATAVTTDDSAVESSASPTSTQDTAFSDMQLSPNFELSQDPTTPRPRLHRAMSHESIISLSGGLDIHTLRARPSQLTLRPLGAASADTGLSAVTAMPTISRGSTPGKRGSMVLRDNLIGLPLPRTAVRAVSGSVSPSLSAASSGQRSASGGLGRWVGWRPWGGTVTSNPSTAVDSSTSATTAQAVESPTSKSGLDGPYKTLREKHISRASGINQAGSIPGFKEYWATHQRRGAPAKVTAETIDTEALREVLEE